MILLRYILPSLAIILVIIGVIYFVIDLIFQDVRTEGFSFEENYGTIGSFFNGVTTPILAMFTTLFALWAFLSQQEQLKLQKEESTRHRIEGTFFQLLDFKNNVVNSLECEAPEEGKAYVGREFFKKTYMDLMAIYNQETGLEEGRLQESMEKLDQIHVNNFHLYYKSLYQVFNWIDEHSEELSTKQQRTYVELIRAQLSHYEMMLIFFNAKFFGRKRFYTMLERLGFLNLYNIDRFGSVESRFAVEAKAYETKEQTTVDTPKQASSHSFKRDELLRAFQNEEFELYYQPIIDTVQHDIVKVEALIRWNHPEKGLVKPASFIDSLEYYGFAAELLEYLMHHVCQAIKKHRSPIVYCVNISIEQLLLSDFLETAEKIRQSYGVRVERLQFEVTESKALYDRPQIKKTLDFLRAKGYLVGLDDFGDGYFSFHDLLDLPIDFVKLDKQFVLKLDEERSQDRGMRYLVDFIRSQGWQIIIEGIETAQQYTTWQKLGVEAMQGFYISQAVPQNQVKRLKRIVTENINKQ